MNFLSWNSGLKDSVLFDSLLWFPFNHWSVFHLPAIVYLKIPLHQNTVFRRPHLSYKGRPHWLCYEGAGSRNWEQAKARRSVKVNYVPWKCICLLNIKSMTDFTDILDRFTCISLAETDRIAPLLKRMDAKFVLSFDRLPAILDVCMSQYSILDIEGCRISRY